MRWAFMTAGFGRAAWFEFDGLSESAYRFFVGSTADRFKKRIMWFYCNAAKILAENRGTARYGGNSVANLHLA
ncbi:MAG: hypothetical protein RQ741_13535 [Wenzhouxiangellaceae bacterium]|nr:hypothetical protein [Wenzhouxiangellaceae bacterium]